MKEKRLLDCTLRDGGYVNGWDFGKKNIAEIFSGLVNAGPDYIEVGFLDERVAADEDKSLYPDMESVDLKFSGADLKNSKILAMIDYGTFGIDKIKPCTESCLDGLRVIFKKPLYKEALEFCAQLKEKGYPVFAQLVSVTDYNDDELNELIEIVNSVKPYTISMVDTYGLLHQDELMHYFDIMDAGLLPDIALGYHGHNNLQMGYANCISVLSKDTDRDIMVDGSLYGMGKSAGNAPVELIAMFMNRHCGKNYDIGEILGVIADNIMPIYKMPTWGYNLNYFLAAYNECHPGYVQYYVGKKRLSIKSINSILGSLEEDKKLIFDEEYAAKKYLGFR